MFQQLDLTTLCAGAFSAFLEALFGNDGEAEAETEGARRFSGLAGLAARRPLTRAEFTFVARDRHRLRPRAGLARSIQARLAASPRGKVLTAAIDQHRG